MNPGFNKTLKSIYGTGNFNPKRFDHKPKKRGRKTYLWVLSFILIAIALASLLSVYFFTRVSGGFSGDKIDTKISGEINPLVGQDQEYVLTIKNNEDVAIDNLELFVGWSTKDFLAGESGIKLVSAQGERVNGNQNTWQIGSLESGEDMEFIFNARFFGEQGAKLDLPFVLTFRPSGFTSDFTIDFEQEFVLGEATIGLNVLAPQKASIGSEIALSISVSTADLSSVNDLNSAWLVVEYPASFNVINEDPNKRDNDSGWLVRTLPVNEDDINNTPGLERQLSIRGTIASQENSVVFKIILFDKENGRIITQREHSINMQSAGLEISVQATPAQGKKLQWNEKLTHTITIKNASNTQVDDLVASISLSGEELWRPGSINISQGGEFDSGNIIWDSQSTSALSSLESGQSVTLNFSLETVSGAPASFSGTPAILTKARVRGLASDQDIIAESGEIITKILANVDFDSNVSSKSGPHPPLPGQTTTYTVTWLIGPTTGALKDIRLSAKLGSGVDWANATNLSVGEIDYSNSSNTVIWQASRIPKIDEAIRVQFDILATPSSQPTNSTVLLEQSSLQATDEASLESLGLINFPLTVGGVR